MLLRSDSTILRCINRAATLAAARTAILHFTPNLGPLLSPCHRFATNLTSLFRQVLFLFHLTVSTDLFKEA